MIYLDVLDIVQLLNLLDSFGIDDEPVEEIIIKMSDMDEEDVCNGGKCNFSFILLNTSNNN